MFKKEYLSSYIKWGIISAIAFCIPLVFFLSKGTFESTWWLYLGNVLFLVAIAAYMISFNKKQNENASTNTMVAAGHIATALGIIISCIVAAILLPMFIPDIFSSGKSDTVLTGSPSQMGTGKTNGLIFIVFMNAIIGNICGGSFSSIIIPYTSRRDQTKDKRTEVLND